MRIAFIISGSITFLGTLFKVQHWPGGGLLLLVGILALFVTLVISGIKCFGSKTNRPLNGAERLIVAFMLFGILFKIQHWPGAGPLLVLSLSSLSLLYWAGTWALLGSGQATEVKFSAPAFALGFIGYSVVAIGIMFKMQHWPGGQVQLLVGLATSAACHVWHWISVKDKEPEYIWHTDTIIRAIWLFGWGGMLALPAG